MSHEQMKLRCIDLFAGIGGIRAGFEQAAGDNILETVFVSEIDQYAAATYAANYRTPTNKIEGLNDLAVCDKEPVIYGDITRVSNDALASIPQFDICLAGFPCQAFSLAGKRLGFDDEYEGKTRGTLFREVVRVCKINKPKVILCENVKGLVHHDNGNTLRVILGAFNEAGYTVAPPTILNSRDFGVPQNRERIYLVAFKDELGVNSFQFPTGAETNLRIKDILEKEPVAAKYYLSEQYLNTLKRHRKRHENRGNGFGYQIKRDTDFASTLSCGGMGRERNLVVDDRPHETGIIGGKHSPINNENVRCMTPREWARLQGFSDSYVMPVADVHLYKQFGNTVTVNVIEAIARNILEVLKEALSAPNLSKILKRSIAHHLTGGPLTQEELLERVNHLFPSSSPVEERLQQLSDCLYELKKEGTVNSSGQTSEMTWHIMDGVTGDNGNY